MNRIMPIARYNATAKKQVALMPVGGHGRAQTARRMSAGYVPAGYFIDPSHKRREVPYRHPGLMGEPVPYRRQGLMGLGATAPPTAAPPSDFRSNLITQLVAVNIAGMHPLSQDQATQLVDNALGAVQDKVSPIAISGVVASVALAYFVAKYKVF